MDGIITMSAVFAVSSSLFVVGGVLWSIEDGECRLCTLIALHMSYSVATPGGRGLLTERVTT